MSADPEAPSPPKKRRLMQGPDGFNTMKRKPPIQNLPARKFKSAFDDPKRSKWSARDCPLPVARPPIRLPPGIPHAGPSRQTLLRVLPDNTAGPSEKVARPPAPVVRNAAVRTLKPPTFPSIPGSNTRFTLKPHLPVPPSRKGSSISHAEMKASIQKFQPALPAPPQPHPAKPGRTLQALQPPPPLLRGGRVFLDPSKLKTITTTRLAVSIDPRTESGADELLALHLCQTASTYVPPAERELNRGLGQSPEKASKSKSAKYTRGGLAERAQHKLIHQSKLLGLWHKDMELQAQRPRDYAPVAPDLRLRISKVLHVTSIASLQRSQNVPRLSVVRCAKVIGGRAVGNLTVLLDFGHPSSAAGKAHTLDEVKEGKDVLVWAPWSSSDAQAEELRRYGARPRDGTTLFCTRFRIS